MPEELPQRQWMEYGLQKRLPGVLGLGVKGNRCKFEENWRIDVDINLRKKFRKKENREAEK